MTRPLKMGRLAWLPLVVCSVGIGIMALFPRWWRLELPVLSYDESFSWRLTQYPLGEMCQRTGADVHPPLHYILLQAWTSVWGDSAAALRALSGLFGLVAIAFTYLAVREAVTVFGRTATRDPAAGAPADSVPARDSCRASVCGGAMLSAVLLAVNTGQVSASRTARMYALGVLLAALTAWLLLRALRAGARRWLSWSVYGIALAGFCATHNYALFTALAQAAFVLGLTLQRAWRRQELWAVASGFAYAALLAIILYSPWLPVLLEQTRQVRQSFWVERTDVDLILRTFFAWATGTGHVPDGVGHLWLLLLAVTVLGTVWWSGTGGWFFLAQAAAPWLGSIAFFLLADRSILLDRCLVFAQVAWTGYWGILWARLGSWPTRAILALFLLGSQVHGLIDSLAQLPDTPPPIQQAAAFLQSQARPDETIWAASPQDVNRLRYYLGRAGAQEMTVRCVVSPSFREGHVIHIAALKAEDVVLAHSSKEMPATRFWIAGAAQLPFDNPGELLGSYRFGEGPDSFHLALYAPKEGSGK